MNSGFVLVALAFVCSLSTVAQDTLFFKNGREEVRSIELCDYYRLLDRSDPDTNVVVEREYFKSGSLKREATFNPYHSRTLHGGSRAWFESGQLMWEATYEHAKIVGPFLTFWENGQLKRKDNYVDGEFVEGEVWDADGNETTYYKYETFPEFPGGADALLEFLGTNIHYPKKAFKSGTQGRVVVSFIVEIDGSVSNIFVINGVSKELDREAARVVGAMPKWMPGMQDGRPVRVQYQLPITFRKTREG